MNNEPQLGLATTGQLLDELRARFEIHAEGGLNYRTVGGASPSPLSLSSAESNNCEQDEGA